MRDLISRVWGVMQHLLAIVAVPAVIVAIMGVPGSSDTSAPEHLKGSAEPAHSKYCAVCSSESRKPVHLWHASRSSSKAVDVHKL
jgi:hypothetical protein